MQNPLMVNLAASDPHFRKKNRHFASKVYLMHCQAVMHDYILVKMPKMETLVGMRRSQEILLYFYG